MIGNALLLALTLFMAFCFLLMDRLKFLVPYRQAIFHQYGWAIGLYAVLLFGNLFAAFFLLARRFFLKQGIAFEEEVTWCTLLILSVSHHLFNVAVQFSENRRV
jgi:hypothetical protein